MCAALQTLGLNPYHFVEVTRNLKNDHFELWLAAIHAKYDGDGTPFAGKDFDQMLWNYDARLESAVTDAPACLFPDELLAAYPSAKVVLMAREPRSWLASMRATALAVLAWRSWSILAWLDTEFSRPYWRLLNRATIVWSAGQPPWHASADAALLRYHEEYHLHVREVVPQEKLLEFHPSHGWAPLCAFLGVSVPDVKFPHVNDSGFFITMHRRIYWTRWRKVMKKAAPSVVVGVVFLAAAFVRRLQGGSLLNFDFM
ncbi:nad dependent epimerase [Diplodia corticola]|uniref:Nad dependent epimerase n=1 Tax=Diplodia corticola TaxID=236234 RepID=A0A1J9QZ45_9PEZI|nr:nad dependent epimerase [Diplodia corticola]OJD33649.1 nad dependent epimerase [Diplodia corticola]